MDSTFERIHQSHPSMESDVQRENLSIALSDQEYLQKVRRETQALDCCFGMREYCELDPSHSKNLKKKLEIANKLTTETFTLQGKDAKREK